MITNIKKLLCIFVGFFLYSVSLLLTPIINIRFGQLYTSRLGHICFSIDNYLNQKKSEVALFSTEKIISNSEILRLWKKQKTIFFSIIPIFVRIFLDTFNISSKKWIYWPEHNPIPTDLNLGKPNIKTDKLFNFKGNQLKKKYNIKDKFICLNNRDPAYMNNVGPDNNEHYYRDFEFKDYTKTLNFFIKKNYSVLRIGKFIQKEYKHPKTNFVSFTGNERTDCGDIFFLKNSIFNIHSLGGVAAVSSLFRKKTLFVNYLPFFLDQLSTAPKKSMFITKKIFSTQKNRLLNFSELHELNNDIHYKGDYYKDHDLKVINNTEEEIFLASKEFYNNLSRTSSRNKMSNLQKEFWQIFQAHPSFDLVVNKLKIRICDSFLEKNKKLIN
jgi:putative glycosyltransferase (TIGR04372 family)